MPNDSRTASRVSVFRDREASHSYAHVGKNLRGGVEEGLPGSASRASRGVPRLALPPWPRAARILVGSTEIYTTWTSLELFNYRFADPLNLSIESQNISGFLRG